MSFSKLCRAFVAELRSERMVHAWRNLSTAAAPPAAEEAKLLYEMAPKYRRIQRLFATMAVVQATFSIGGAILLVEKPGEDRWKRILLSGFLLLTGGTPLVTLMYIFPRVAVEMKVLRSLPRPPGYNKPLHEVEIATTRFFHGHLRRQVFSSTIKSDCEPGTLTNPNKFGRLEIVMTVEGVPHSIWVMTKYGKVYRPGLFEDIICRT
mmetsp:Transcript_37023/g.59945  ORF Transcript_37023/g.59945 Transcript_37023/m.59945 type:complete len:207 (-) Transcript_37023:449-1069(-)